MIATGKLEEGGPNEKQWLHLMHKEAWPACPQKGQRRWRKSCGLQRKEKGEGKSIYLHRGREAQTAAAVWSSGN